MNDNVRIPFIPREEAEKKIEEWYSGKLPYNQSSIIVNNARLVRTVLYIELPPNQKEFTELSFTPNQQIIDEFHHIVLLNEK